MSVTIYINTTDVSDYVIDIGDVPYQLRNRNKSLVAEGFSFSLSVNAPAVPANGDTIKVFHNNVIKYVGYAKRPVYNYDADIYDIEVLHWLYKWNDYKIDYDTLHSLLAALDWASGTAFTIDENDNILSTGHGLSANTKLRFKTQGALPTPLTEEGIFYVLTVDADKFQVSLTAGGAPVGLTGGVGDSKYYTTSSDVSFDNYIPEDNEGYPFVSISRLIKISIELINAVLDDSDIDVKQYYQKEISAVTYNWTLSQFKIDENMLYALNQNFAANHTIVDNGENENSKITLFELMVFISGIFGLVFELTDDSPLTYKVYEAEFGTYTISDDNYYSLKRYTDPAVSGYNFKREFNTARSVYAAASEVDIDVEIVSANFTVNAATNIFTSSSHGLINDQEVTVLSSGILPSPLTALTPYYVIYIDTNTFKLSETQGGSEIDIVTVGSGTHTLRNASKVGTGEKSISVFNNFRLLLEDQTGGVPDGEVLDVNTHEWPVSDMLRNEISAIYTEYDVEEASTDITLSDPTIRQEYLRINDTEEVSVILKETE
jgi:hypothetical protein